MKLRVIKTEADHEEALARIEEIFDAKPGTAEGCELELLSLLVERYEEEAFPIDLPDPVSAIRFRMEQHGLRNKDLVPYIGSASKVSEVLSGQRNLSLTMIRNLVKGLDIPPEVLIGLPDAQLAPEADVKEFLRFPIAEMVKRGWFPGFTGTAREARGQLEDLIKGFVGPLGYSRSVIAFNRQHIRAGGKYNQYHLAAWRLRVMSLAQKEKLPDYSQSTINQGFLKRLVQLSIFETGPLLAKELLNKHGIHVVIEPHLPKTHLDGAAMKLPDGSPIIALTLRHDRLDNFWFTLFHELAHVSLHLYKDGAEAYFDDLSDGGKDKCETEADKFAQEALIPSSHWKKSGLPTSAKADRVLTLANELHISPSIPAGRVRHERKNYYLLKEYVGQGKLRCLFDKASHN